MRSVLARIIALTALIPLVANILEFLPQTRELFHFGSLAVRGGSLIMFSHALLGPLGLLGTAAVVEMLFRISTALPASDEPQATQAPLWPWRSTVARALLVVAIAAYVVSGWAAVQFMLKGGWERMGMPASEVLQGTFSVFFYWLTAPLEIIAWAAVIEYLFRIAAAVRPARPPPA